jgi:hypothetical protein
MLKLLQLVELRWHDRANARKRFLHTGGTQFTGAAVDSVFAVNFRTDSPNSRRPRQPRWPSMPLDFGVSALHRLGGRVAASLLSALLCRRHVRLCENEGGGQGVRICTFGESRSEERISHSDHIGAFRRSSGPRANRSCRLSVQYTFFRGRLAEHRSAVGGPRGPRHCLRWDAMPLSGLLCGILSIRCQCSSPGAECPKPPAATRIFGDVRCSCPGHEVTGLGVIRRIVCVSL